jgi:hypothetical protein
MDATGGFSFVTFYAEEKKSEGKKMESKIFSLPLIKAVFLLLF